MRIIKGVSHLTFSVSDLEASTAFYQQVFEAELLFREEKTAYFALVGLWLALNVQENIPREEVRQSYTHTAFRIDAADIKTMAERLVHLGIPLIPSRAREIGEGLSLYFADPDGHLLEVHSGTLETRLRAYHQSKNS